jgi:hypothetical protein
MRRLWTERTRTTSWGGGAVSLVATATSFVAAFLAMTTVRTTFPGPVRTEVPEASIVFLEPPRPQIPPRAEAVVVKRSEIVNERTIPEPTSVPSTPGSPPGSIDNLKRDTSTASPAPVVTLPLIPILPLRALPTDTSDTAGRGARTGRATAGVTAHESSISAAARDSIATALMFIIPKLARERKATPDEVDRLRRQRDPGLDATGRAARLPGEPVFAPTMGGNVAVAIPILSFSVGRRPDRAKDSAIHADNMARLRRLQDLAIWRRDSIRADSLRRDSLARAGRSPKNR